ncbi:MAG: helix-turn-helix domain-containing protein [Ignavibacteriales bacterium]|nr:helix-turn-helix domain-containing protein [Ignavibacteriales bacterium]
MTTQPTDHEKAAILAQILKSSDFQDSKKHQELLKFLAERPESADPLKETEIALAVFGKDSKFDPSTDSLIRSYISNLRKKLDHYYLTTKDTYSHKLEIPKGHYVIKFSSAVPKEAARRFSKSLPVIRIGSWIVLLVLVVVLSFREYSRRTIDVPDATRTAANPLWNEFLQTNGRPTLIVVGDFFFLHERDKNDGYYRTVKINSIDDYLEYISKNPEFGKRYAKSNFTFLRPSAPWGLMQILPILQNAPGGISLKLASQFTSDDFKSHNIVFIGSFKTLYLLKTLLSILKIEYAIAPSSFRIQDGITDSLHVFTPERLSAGSLEKDYGVVAKGRGPDGSFVMMLLGFSESGVIQATHAASDPLLLRAIEKKYPSGTAIDPSSLTVVIGAEGITQSLFNADIKYVSGLGAPQPALIAGQKDSTRSK